MKKKGFTLIELLAVIAILAILVIIAVPNVLKLFKGSTEKTFTSEVQNMIREAENKFVSLSLGSKRVTCFDSNKNKLDLDGRSDMVYLIRLSNKGKITEIKIVDNTYELIATNENGIKKEDIGKTYKVNQRGQETIIFDCDGSLIFQGSETKYPIISFDGSTPNYGYLNDGKLYKEDKTTQITKLDKVVEKEGYDFLGYYIPNTEDKVIDEVGNIVEENLSKLNSTTVLESKYEAHTYTVEYNANEGTGQTTSSTHTYDKEEKLTANNFTRDGYQFVGWSLDKTSKVITYENNEIVKNLTSDKNGRVTLYAIWSKVNYTFTGNYETFVVPKTGVYKIELWGGQGGASLMSGKRGKEGGNGAYTTGKITLNKDEELYIYVGGKGVDAVLRENSLGGYNGGGLGTTDGSDDETSGGGGGATDVRLTSGKWDNFESLKSRIMVAAGGGGRSWEFDVGEGGGLSARTLYDTLLGGSQTSGYALGKGMDGVGYAAGDGVGGGGGGYYGGKSQNVRSKSSGSGGSSFISGHPGCKAITATSTENNIKHLDSPNHYSGKVFTETQMIAGNESMPKPDGGTEVGHTGNGYAKITLLN